MRTKADWTLIEIENCEPSRLGQGHCLIVPYSQQLENVPVCLTGLLPTHNHNRKLLEILAGFPENAFAKQSIIAGIFAADSFLPFADLVRTLERVGIRKITNFPTITAYGSLVEKTLDNVGLGFACECEKLARFRQHGFKTATVLRETRHKAMIKEEDNFALIELAHSNKQSFSRLFNQKTSTQRLFLRPDGTAPECGRPPSVDGLIIAI